MAKTKAKTKKPSAAKIAKDPFDRFHVNLWLTNLNTTEIGIYQHARHRAKSRQFTQDMDILGEIKENGVRTGLVAYRKHVWKKEKGMKRRLVIKLFSAEMNWRATMDLLLARSIDNTHGARGVPVTIFSINLSGHEYLVKIERSANKWPGMPEWFSFFILSEDKVPRYFRLRRCFVNVGGDYILYDRTGKRIGKLNGRVVNFGGAWKCKIKKEHSDKLLKHVLMLFCTHLKFNKDAQKHIKSLVRDMHRGRLKFEDLELEQQEADLYENPRRIR